MIAAENRELEENEDVLPLNMEIEFSRGSISGEILSGGLARHHPWPAAMMEGTVSGSTADVDVWDTIGGEKVIIARLRFQREADDGLSFQVLKQSQRYFPDTAALTRSDPKEFKKLPRLNDELLERVTTKAKAR
ncbi:hypothetical protein [Sphingobium sp. EM0848]|uniref:hypothetical protein n=1 Tax=Sphingobium sp. EM0848 TaxID=2743473 RepID=UPI00159C67F6|nr:hypothetical protein [Sphingobium sp. EM0848]